tara:strand:+ start:5138 stop:5443 length:306 start_codon:yes stop_codon:yes gene_type:complete
MSLSYNHRNKNNFSKLDNRYLLIFFLPILSLIIGFIIFINNRSEQLKLNQIPSIEKNIKILNDQKIIALKKKDFLIRNHIKDQAKKNGMIKANFSKNIIKW